MTKTIVIAGLLTFAGCDKNDDTRASEAREPEMRVQPARPAADDLRRGERDEVRALNPTDQSESEGDRNITREIRQGVMDQENFSMNAKNAKIITRGGVVTLRGLVDTAAERADIARLARSASGVKHVDNQLEVGNPD